jgi:hypothetical protein
MATITTGVSKTFSIPGVPWSRVAAALHRACVTERYAFPKIANLAWKGSTRPMILWATRSMPQYWAQCKMGGWGRGVVYFSNHPSLVKRMAAWSDDTWMGLAYHEMGHLLANTWNQDIGYPPKPWFVSALQKHWGKPKVTDEEPDVVDFSVPGELSLWDRMRMLVTAGVGLAEWNGERP